MIAPRIIALTTLILLFYLPALKGEGREGKTLQRGRALAQPLT